MAELDSRSPRGEDFSRADFFPEDYPTEEALPRSGAPRPAGGSHSARPAPLRKRRTPPPARNSGRGWRRFLLIYTLLFLLAGAAGLFVFYRYLDAYEQSRPSHVMDALMAE